MIAGFVLMVLSVPLALILPVELSFENGLIENLQVAVLIFGAAFNLKLCLESKVPQLKLFHGFCAALILFLVMRELSWGRVFFPVGMSEAGPIFVSMDNWDFGVPVRIFRAIYGAALLAVLVKFLPLKKLLLGRQPVALILLFVMAVALNYIGERGFIIGKARGQILEELNKLVIYLNLPAACLYYRDKISREVEVDV